MKEMTEKEHHKESVDTSVLAEHLTSSVYDEIPTTSVVMEPKLVPMGQSCTYEDMSSHVLQPSASVGPYEMMASVFLTPENSKTVIAEKNYAEVKTDV